MFKQGDRVTVVRGEHAGRRGMVTVVGGESAAYDKYLKVTAGQFLVGLDGERGQTQTEGGTGGRGGINITATADDLQHE